MNKKVFQNTNLVCQFQKTGEALNGSRCLSGVISRTDDGFRFEEAAKQKRCRLNPKLFDGEYCSLVHMQNGKYHVHMKTINADGSFEPHTLAFGVYCELLEAFNIID